MYKYKPLDPTTRQTRIVRLDGSIHFDAPLVCELCVHEPPGEQLKYDAISYTWGGQVASTEHPLHIRNQDQLSVLPITPNAYHALRRMRLRTECRNLWIDSVSIDQDNLEEKSLQVRNMGHIYTCANKTLVWLGDVVSPWGQSTLNHLKRIGAGTAPAEAVIQNIFTSLREESKPKFEPKSIGSVKTWSVMEEFFSHPWFTRVWTLQEIALHCFDPIFYYGDETITLSVIIQAKSVMTQHGFDHALVIHEALESHLILRSMVREWRSLWRRDDRGLDLLITLDDSGKKRPQLKDLLKQSRRMDASRAIDNIYGIYGICEWLDIYQPPPQYQVSFEDASLWVTCAAIQSGIEGREDLSVLYDASEPRSNKDLPSWVPDWSHGSRRLCGGQDWPMKKFDAGGPIPLYNIDYKDKILAVKGVIVDKIHTLGPEVETNENMPFFANLSSGDDWMMYESVADDCWATWKVFCAWASLIHSRRSQASIMDQFMSVVLGESITSIRPDAKYRLDSHKAKEAFARWYEALLTTNTEVAKEREQRMKDLMNRVYCVRYMFGDGTDLALRQVHFAVWAGTTGKRLFVTKEGRVGLGRGKLATEQELAVLGGLTMPLILEPAGARYRLAGYAYLFGIMEGQAWPYDPSQLQIIRLQ